MRSDHSLGVCHLAERWAEHFKGIQGKDLGIEKSDVTCVAIAGEDNEASAPLVRLQT